MSWGRASPSAGGGTNVEFVRARNTGPAELDVLFGSAA